jgi:Holliday junction resolvasome RuvABC endonuclease subunit
MTRRNLTAGIGGGTSIQVSTPALSRVRSVRVLGVDPGSTIGIAMLSVLRPSATGLLVGAWRAASDRELDEALVRLSKILDEEPIDLVAVERVEHVHGSDRMGSSYAEGLTRAAWIGGEIAGAARARGLKVVTVDAPTWRSALVGSRRASDAEVKRMVLTRIPGWPSSSNAHERDAAGVALWAGLKPALEVP